MFTGQRLSLTMLEQFIAAGTFATNLPTAYRKFGPNFIPVRPIPPSCIESIQKLNDPGEHVEENICYVPVPGTTV